MAKAGAFAVVLEGVEESLAREITKKLSVPTIGIGASPGCDGQVLVTEDMLGLTPIQPRFVKKYAELSETVSAAVQAYAKGSARPQIPHHRPSPIVLPRRNNMLFDDPAR